MPAVRWMAILAALGCGLAGSLTKSFGDGCPNEVSKYGQCPYAPGTPYDATNCNDYPNPSATFCPTKGAYKKVDGWFLCGSQAGSSTSCDLAWIENPLVPGTYVPVKAVCCELNQCFYATLPFAHCDQAGEPSDYWNAQTTKSNPCSDPGPG